MMTQPLTQQKCQLMSGFCLAMTNKHIYVICGEWNDWQLKFVCRWLFIRMSGGSWGMLGTSPGGNPYTQRLRACFLIICSLNPRCPTATWGGAIPPLCLGTCYSTWKTWNQHIISVWRMWHHHNMEIWWIGHFTCAETHIGRSFYSRILSGN